MRTRIMFIERKAGRLTGEARIGRVRLSIWEWRGWSPQDERRTILHGCGFFQIRDGKIVLQRGYWDKLTFLRAHQLPLDAAVRG